MNNVLKTLAAAVVSLSTTAALAAPKFLITHNQTNVESNAYVAGTIPSQHPTKANRDGKVSWIEVRMACFGHDSGGKCSALIKMATNTPNPVNLGTVSVDLNSGDISPKVLHANGYTLTVNGPGETTLTKD